MNYIKPIKIGAVTLPSNLLLAPMAGYTDLAFRRLCRDAGAGLTTTEMVSVRGFVHNSKNTAQLLALADNETPSCVQLFGSDPADFSAALSLPALEKFDIIDINMGCPMPKITRNGDGSELLKNPKLAAEIVEACVKSTQISGRPVTVKTRLGISDKQNTVDFCRALESAGASAVAVHGRTVKQLYGGAADWEAIGTVAAALKVPVIGNGDVSSREEAMDRIKDYGVAGVIVGRGAIGNPGIFLSGQWTVDSGQLLDGDDSISTGKAQPSTVNRQPSTKKNLLRHIGYALEAFPERYVVTSLRKHFVYYLKGIPGVKDLKAELCRITDAKTLIAAIESAPI
ncbi:MAG: tRNA dihydrouridine synthase DusB [Firmicutes bacterium]|nr:tRNA dihydrouridine synthase DusB [Bacillota bacterium]